MLFKLSRKLQSEPHLRLQKCRSYFLFCVFGWIESAVIFFFVSRRARARAPHKASSFVFASSLTWKERKENVN